MSFGGTRPARLRVGATRDPTAVSEIRALPGGQALDLHQGVIALPRGANGITYSVDVERLSTRDRWVRRGASAAVVLAPDDLLVRADGALPHDGAITVRVDARNDVHVSAAWNQRRDGAYVVPTSTFLARGWMVLDTQEPWRFDAAGCHFEVVTLAPITATREGLERWLGDAARAVAGGWGTMPPTKALVILRPSNARTFGAGDAVLFGSAMHGGGSTLLLYIDAGADDASLPGEWIAVHEMVHLAMPRVRSGDPWFTEGVATYYQEILRARAGMISANDAWRRLGEGFARGRRQSGRATLRAESDAMNARHAYQRVYWSGAAIALLLDVELRQRGRTLDDAMREMTSAFGSGRRPASADEVLTHLDDWLGEPLFTTTAAKHLASRAFPDVDAALRSRANSAP